MKLKKSLFVIGASCVLLFTAFGSMAYMTDRGVRTNKFTTAYVDVELQEPHWSVTDRNGDGVPDATEDLHQNQVSAKDPVVVNRASVPIYVFLQVKVPKRAIMLVNSAPNQVVAELFTYTVHNQWQLLSETYTSTQVERWYGYKTRVAVGGKTVSLFDSVTYAPVVEGQIADTEKLTIPVSAYGIQGKTFSSMAQAWSAFDKSQTEMSNKTDQSNRTGGAR